MPEQIKEIQKRIIEYWNKWTVKQKIIIGAIAAGVIVAIALIVFILGRTKYTELYRFNSTETASQAVAALKENSISSKLSSDKKTVLVDEKAYVDAIVTVSNAEFSDKSFNISDMLDTSLTTTNGERLLRQHLRSEANMEEDIKKFDGVVSVSISYIAKDTSNSILASNRSIPASVTLETNSSFKESEAIAIAKIVAAGVGNTGTDDVTVVNTKGKVLFDGSIEETDELDPEDKRAVMDFFKTEYINAVTGALVMNGFTDVDVAPNLDVNFDKANETFNEVIPIEGEIHGVLIEEHTTDSSSTSNNGDIPGTDSNDETDYMLLENSGGNTESSTMDRYYTPSQRIKNVVYDTGTVLKENSSIAVTAVKVISRTEKELKVLGLLEDVSFEEYSIKNAGRVKTETPDYLIKAIALATGIDEDKVSLETYDVYQFIPNEKLDIDYTTIVQIVLVLLLLGILLFVIFRGMKPVEITEVEPELSIEQLLATTKEGQGLEDVEFSEMSETRKMIEKFFNENPEAVASLLRNWLNDDWM